MGVLPLVHLKSALFGNSLVSMPFVDGGGILADAREVEEGLLFEAVAFARRLRASRIELRCERGIATCDEAIETARAGVAPSMVTKRTDKVRMVLNLPGSSKELLKCFRSKLRSQINRPLKDGCISRTGGLELLEHFYRVFLINMRELGSPVHSKQLMHSALGEFPACSQITIVYHAGAPVAAGFVMGFKGMMRNLWASSDRRYSSMSPNMLLYLRMLEFACDNGYGAFDFGRSTRDEGTYRFKEQWGAKAVPLHWYVASPYAKPIIPDVRSKRFEMAARCWRTLPLGVTKVIGPRIRKHISL